MPFQKKKQKHNYTYICRMFVILQAPQTCIDLGSGLNHCVVKYIYTNNRETLILFNMAYLWGEAHAGASVWRSEVTLWNWFPASPLGRFQDRCQVSRLAQQALCLLSRLRSPSLLISAFKTSLFL